MALKGRGTIGNLAWHRAIGLSVSVPPVIPPLSGSCRGYVVDGVFEAIFGFLPHARYGFPVMGAALTVLSTFFPSCPWLPHSVSGSLTDVQDASFAYCEPMEVTQVGV